MQQSTEHGALAWRTTFIHEGVAAAGPLIACLHGSAVRWLSSHWATFPHQRHARGCYNMLCNAQAKPFHGIGLPAGAHQGWWSSGQDTAIGSPLEDRGQHPTKDTLCLLGTPKAITLSLRPSLGVCTHSGMQASTGVLPLHQAATPPACGAMQECSWLHRPFTAASMSLPRACSLPRRRCPQHWYSL